jgi:Ca2+-transporting ATPase
MTWSSSAFSPARDVVDPMGLRVLGVARASFAGQISLDSQHDFAFEFIGLVGLADPLRQSVPDAVNECRLAGIKVVMITGDYPATAKTIARQAGLDAEDYLVPGEELDQLSEANLALRVCTATVFARLMPEQKLRIVNALKANGEIVAMTGDGVNDAPSLKAAHIGAMAAAEQAWRARRPRSYFSTTTSVRSSRPYGSSKRRCSPPTKKPRAIRPGLRIR